MGRSQASHHGSLSGRRLDSRDQRFRYSDFQNQEFSWVGHSISSTARLPGLCRYARFAGADAIRFRYHPKRIGEFAHAFSALTRCAGARGKTRARAPQRRIETELRALIRRMSIENPLWGAPRIHGELLKLGFEVAQSSVAKSMIKRRGPPSQGCRTFMHNHAPDLAAMDLSVVPTIGFGLLYAFVIVRLGRRDLVWIKSQPIRPPIGSRARSLKHYSGTTLGAT